MSSGYLKYLQILVPLLRDDTRVRHLQVIVPASAVYLPGLEDLQTLSSPALGARSGYRRLGAHLRQLAPDVVFFPTARWLDCGRVPSVTMVRNMEPLTVPFGGNSLVDGIKNLARASAARSACRRATRVIAVSHHVRDFLVGTWGIGAHKVGVVYHGIETPPDPAEAVKPQALNGCAPDRFLFTAGSIRPARGLEGLVRAVPILQARHKALNLVIAGEPNRGSKFHMGRLQRLAEDLGVESRIVWAGQLSSPEMSWCYYHCAAFVMTSRAEACPNIALEAMSHGCQIVSTRQPPMPEFFAQSASYYQAQDARDLVGKIALTLEAPREQHQLRRKAAQARADDFKWSDTARRTIDQLALAVSESCRGTPQKDRRA